MPKLLKSILTLCGAFLILPQIAAAQNTGGVFPPTVNDGHKSAQYRVTFSDNDRSAQRAHYQQAVNGDVMWRIVGQVKSDGFDTDFDYLQGELFWDLSEGNPDYSQGLRFDARYRDDNRSHQVGVNWMHQFKLSDTWTARALVLTAAQFGDNAADGVALQTRGSLIYNIDKGVTAGAELYNSYGTTDNFLDLVDEGQHQLGPFVSFPVFEKTSLYAGALFGLTDVTPDSELRLWLTQGF